MKINIHRNEDIGVIEYNEKDKTIIVSFSDTIFEKLVMRCLTADRAFSIPESNKIDDVRQDFVKPTENETYMELALCTLFADTGVSVDWKSLEK